MANARDVLSEAAYTNYRNVRAVALLFIVLGGVLCLGGIGAATGDKKPTQPGREPIPVAAAVGICVAGLIAVVGGVATRAGNRRWAPLAKVIAYIYLLGFPLGTILSYTLLKGFSQYFKSLDRLRRAEDDDDGQDERDDDDEDRRRRRRRDDLE